MVIKKEPPQSKWPKYPPEGAQPWNAEPGDTLRSIAPKLKAAKGLTCTWEQLAEFNFQTSSLPEVNWCLFHILSWRKEAIDTYQFAPGAPGKLYIPAPKPVPDPSPSNPNARRRRSHPVSRAPRPPQYECGTSICRSCPRVEEYIAAVERAERLFPHITPVKLVTALRKIWNWGCYGGTLWNYMLKDARTKPLDVENSVSGQAFSDYERWLLRGINCLRTPQHVCTDIGHMLAGVDATNHPKTSWLVIGLDTPPKVVAACTWSGDVGSVYRNWRINPGKESSMSEREDRERKARRLQEAWAAAAPDEDLLGDVDGVVLGWQFSSDPNRRFSVLLRKYYGSANTQAAIFRDFASLHSISKQKVKEYAWAWVQARDLGVGAKNDSALDQVADRFLDFVERGKAGRIQRRCEDVRKAARQRPQGAPAAS